MKKIFLLILLFPFVINYAQTILQDRFSQEKLMKEGYIAVTIGGDFIVNGTFTALLSERVDQFVTRIYNEARQEALQQVANQPEQLSEVLEDINKYVFRDIKLSRLSGEELKIDLVKFRMTGNFDVNPFLRNDDVIIFPSANIETNFFTVGGAVASPGKFYYMDTDKLEDAILLAGGIDKAYENIERIEIQRLNSEGTDYTIINASIEENPSIQRGDRIIVVARPNEKRAFTVRILGEVNFPGEIPVTKNNTSINEVIAKAGGVKETAALNRARLYSANALNSLIEKRYDYDLDAQYWNRELSEFILNFEHSLFFRMSNVTEEDSLYFLIENEIRSLTKGASIDFSGVGQENSETANYYVTDGDIIIIPPKLNKVYIFGQVNDPGYVSLEESNDYEYYINKAGGYGEFADRDRTMIIKGRSLSWISPSPGINLEDGDYIFVAKEPVRSFSFYLQRVTNYLTIAGSIATIVLLMVQLTE